MKTEGKKKNFDCFRFNLDCVNLKNLYGSKNGITQICLIHVFVVQSNLIK